MPTTQINQLPAGTAHVDAIVAADNATLTATEKIKLGDIAKLATDASQLTTGTLPDARLSSNIVRTNDVRLSDARTPLAHNQAAETITTGTLSDARLSGNVPLLVNGLIPANVLPSFVDDVLEFNDVAAFPATGEANKIYVVLTGGNANKIYRWSGSAYVEVSPSPGSTDAVPEGATNQYFTTTRAANAAPVQSVAGRTGAITLAISDVSGLRTELDAITSDPRWNLFLPAAPTNLSGSASNAQVALTWTAPSVLAQTPITDYFVQYKVSGAESWTAFSDGTSTAASATVTGLTNGTAYVFRVAAVNGIGTGAYSSASAAFTPITTPGTPTSLSATEGNATLSLSWTAPTTNGGATITGYRVEYTPAGSSAQTVNTGTTATTYELSGLVNGTAYTVRVAAINAAGAGSYSSPAYGTPVNPVTVPGAPTNLSGTAGNNQASLTWTAPSSDGGAAISDYVVQYSPDGGTTWVGEDVSAITITSQPSNQTASNGAATFSVTAIATKSATLSYQWQKQESGAGAFSNVSGATSSSLVLSGLTNADDNGDVYRVVVSATGGATSVSSSSATLTVAAAGDPASTPASIAVSGGSYWWNGTYTLDGESGGRPRYGFSYPGEQRNYIYWTGSAWQIGVPAYYQVWDTSAADTAMPPKTGWSIATLTY
jgi:hypothetical protein